MTRRLSVTKGKPAEGIMVTGSTDAARSDKTRLLMAALTELRGVVAIAAVRLPGVRCARMTRQERRRMEA